MHEMAAAFTGVSDLALDKDESGKLAKAISDVGDHYGLATVFDDKTVAWVNLGQTIIAIYGTRLMTIRLKSRMAKETAAQKAREQPQVIQPQTTDARRNNAPTPSAEIPGIGTVEVPLQ